MVSWRILIEVLVAAVCMLYDKCEQVNLSVVSQIVTAQRGKELACYSLYRGKSSQVSLIS